MSARRVFELSPLVRYVAIYRRGELTSQQRGELSEASSAESDKYEELLVNPTLLKLVQQRGNIDCGGARYIVVRYGNFYQLIIALPDGHVSVCFEPTANPLEYVSRIEQILLSGS